MAIPDGSGYVGYPGTLGSGVFPTTWFNSQLNFCAVMFVFCTYYGIRPSEFHDYFVLNVLGDDVHLAISQKLFKSKPFQKDNFSLSISTLFSELNLTVKPEEVQVFYSPFRNGSIPGPTFLKNELRLIYCSECSKVHLIFIEIQRNFLENYFFLLVGLLAPIC